jgi:drug/metabolite transporter (DMT)-like permease
VIFGLGAALGWGSADLLAALAGRRIGAFRTVLIAQVISAIAISTILLLIRPDLARLGGVVWWLIPNAVATASAYFLLYRALEVGPVHLVSPLLAAYGVLPVLLAVVLLHESLAPLTVLGVTLTIGGAVLSSADLRATRTGARRINRALPWALASATLFGIVTYTFGWATRRAGWLPTLWFSRTCGALLFVLIAVVLGLRRSKLGGRIVSGGAAGAIGFALALGFVDIFGTASFGYGAEVGLISIVTAVSAIYPLIPVLGGVFLFGERPAPNQFVGVGLVVVGLALLGVGA